MRDPILELRRAETADVAQLAIIFKRSRNDAMPYLPLLHDEAEDRQWLVGQVTGDGEVWVAVADVPAGFVATRSGWLDNLYVAPQWQGQGVGSALLRLAQSRQAHLQLWVFQKNTRAIAFYESHGFVLDKLTDGNANEEREPDALYVWHKG